MRRVPMLSQSHPVRLSQPSLDIDCLRRNHLTGRMSTFEAIAQALGILEGAVTEAAMLTFFRHILDRMAHHSRRKTYARRQCSRIEPCLLE